MIEETDRWSTTTPFASSLSAVDSKQYNQGQEIKLMKSELNEGCFVVKTRECRLTDASEVWSGKH